MKLSLKMASQKEKLHKIETVVQESGADIRDVKNMLVRLSGGAHPAAEATAAAPQPRERREALPSTLASKKTPAA